MLNRPAMDNTVAQFLMQLGSRAPILLVYAIGVILAIVYWKRYPRPCLLVFAALCLAGFTLVASAFLFVNMPRVMEFLDWGGFQELSMIVGIVAFAVNLLHAGAMALLLSAVFVGRRQPAPRWSPDDDRTVADHTPEPRGIQGDITDTGIQR